MTTSSWTTAWTEAAKGDVGRSGGRCLQILANVSMHQHRHEVDHPGVAEQVLCDARELKMDELRVELSELAGDLRLRLPHPLFEILVAR